MSAKFYAILTDLGAAKLANATALGTSLDITTMAVGDGGGTVPTPTASQTALIGEKRRAPLNSINIDPNNPNQIITEQIIPEDVGGWWIREIGLFDKDGILIAVANCPDTYKPQLSEGSGRTQAVRMIIIVSNTAAITLKIDPSVVLATRKYVEQSIFEHEKTLKHPDATLSSKGFVQLNSAVNSDSTTQAATPSAIKQAYDLAASKLSSVPDASTSASGIVKLNSATNSDLETEAATPKAVKIAYDLASSKLSSIPVASTTQPGITQLNDAVNNTSINQAATANAVKKTYDFASTKANGNIFSSAGAETNMFNPAKNLYFVCNNSNETGVASTEYGLMWGFDGTGRLMKGRIPTNNIDGIAQTTGASTQNIMSQKATTDAINVAASVGVNQSWINMTASRTAGVNYTNTTGRPICVILNVKNTLAGLWASNITVSGLEISLGSTTQGEHRSIFAVIPNGAIYSYNPLASSGSAMWELR